MDYKELAQRVKQKYPGQYDDLDDKTLAQKIVSKYPDSYGDTTFNETASVAQEPSIKEKVSSFARPVLEIGGAVGGGALGAGAGGVGGMGGAALGYAGGKSAADALDEFLGLKNAPANIPEVATRTGENLLEGAKMEALGMALHPVVKGMASTLIKGGKKIAGPLFGVSDEALNAYLKDPKSIKDASMEGLARKLPNVAEKFNDVISYFSKNADDLLSTSKFLEKSANDPGGAFTKDEITKALSAARKSLGGLYTDEGRTAAKALGRIGESFKRLGNTVSQSQVKGIIQKLDDEIPWTKVWKSPESLTAADNALIKTRTRLDGLLKTKNPEYGEAMKPVSEAIQSRNEFIKKFGIQDIKGQGYTPADVSATRLSAATKEGKIDTQRVLERVKKITGADILPQVEMAKYNEEFFGNRKVNPMTLDLLTGTGAMLGGALGGFGGVGTGAIAGKMASGLVEKYGGVGGSKILDLVARAAGGPSPIAVLSDPVLRRLIAAQSVKTVGGDSQSQIQNLLELLRARPAMAR